MALNFSRRPIFAAHMSEDNFVSPMGMVNGCLVEGIPERNGDRFPRSHYANREVDDCFDFGRDRIDGTGSPESLSSRDIIDLLPSDPFGMDMSTTFTAITGWLEDLEVDYGGYGCNKAGASKEDYGLFAGLNLIWNDAMKFQSFPASVRFGEKSSPAYLMDRYDREQDVRNTFREGGSGPLQNMVGILGLGYGGTDDNTQKIEASQESAECSSDGDGGSPHDALFFALSYIGVRDLLSAQMVCKSLQSAVRSDPLLWRSIHIDQPLNEKITDDILIQLTSRARGYLQCLSLIECPRVTDDGLRCVLEANPRLTKLCVPGCTRLSIEGIVNGLKVFNSSKDMPGIKNIRIGGLYGITNEHFEELKSLLGANGTSLQDGQKPHFYHRGNFYLSCDDDRTIDVEICPRCEKLRLVYDCPAEGCQAKDVGSQVCRGCTLCIARCVQCGRCINDSEYEETFCLEFLCSDCMKPLVKCQEKQDRSVGPSRNSAHYETSSHKFFHHG